MALSAAAAAELFRYALGSPMDVIADPTTAIEELRRRGLPDVFEPLWASEGLGPFGCFGQPPNQYFGMAKDLIGLAPGAAGFCPLWEINGEAVVGVLPSGAYIRIYYEDLGEGDGAIQHLADSYDEFVQGLLTRRAEAGDWEWFERIARTLRYPDPAGLKARLIAGLSSG
jgi:hypothetical protein